MKRYHALGILIAASIVFVSACSMAIGAEQRPTICPMPTQENSGYVATDDNGDGELDTVWHVYISGPCAGFTVNDVGIPYVKHKTAVSN